MAKLPLQSFPVYNKKAANGSEAPDGGEQSLNSSEPRPLLTHSCLLYFPTVGTEGHLEGACAFNKHSDAAGTCSEKRDAGRTTHLQGSGWDSPLA